VAVAAVIAMITIELTVRRSIFMGIKLMAKLVLVGRIVTVRKAVYYHIRSGFQAHEEH